MRTNDTTTAYGFCECGCGERTRLAPQTHRKMGWVKGEPLRFVSGHNTRKKTATDYLVQDCGYETPCWVWQRGRFKAGYGSMGRNAYAHRVYYERAKGPIPSGMDIDHLCRNRACVNPDHLEVVTRAVNLRRGATAKLTEADVKEIRADKTTHYRVLAERYGVAPVTILNIRTGYSWKDVRH